MIHFIKKNWLLILILVLATFFRLYKIGDYMEYLGDQGRDVVIIRDFLKNGDLFFIGPQTSIGNMYLGPFYYYLIAPSLWLANFNPIGPAIFVALLGIITVWLIFYVSAVLFSQSVGFIAAFLYAISPVVIKYSNFSWNPNVMPLFALLFIFFVYRRRYLLASLAFILVINSHFLGLLLLPVALIYWFIRKDYKLKIKETLLAILLFFVSLTPQILFDIKHQGQNISSIIKFFTYRETTVSIKPYKAIPNLIPLNTQILTRLVAAKDPSLGIIVSIVFVLGCFWIVFIKKIPNSPLFLIWYLIGLVGLGLYKQHIYDHYFGFIFPSIFILTALIINSLPRFGLILLLPLFVFALINSPLRYPLYQLKSDREIVASIIKAANNQPFNFALLAKQNYDPPYKYFFYESNAPLYDIKDKLTEQLFVVCEPFQIDCNPISNPEWAVAAFGWAKIDQHWQYQDKQIYRLIHTQPVNEPLKK